jgi:hypothetical protein
MLYFFVEKRENYSTKRVDSSDGLKEEKLA